MCEVIVSAAEFERGVVGLERHVLEAVGSPAILARHIAQCVHTGTVGYECEVGPRG